MKIIDHISDIDYADWRKCPSIPFDEIIRKCLKSAQIQSYENPCWEFEVIVAVVQPTFSISTDFTRMIKSG